MQKRGTTLACIFLLCVLSDQLYVCLCAVYTDLLWWCESTAAIAPVSEEFLVFHCTKVLEYFTFGSLSGENITSFVFQDYQFLPYLGNAIPLVANVGHTSLNLSLPPYADLWIHNAPNEFTSDDVNHLLYISNSYLRFVKHFQNNTFSSRQPLNNPGDGLSKLLELFNHILLTVLWQLLSYMFGNVAQYIALIAILCALIHGLLLPIIVVRLLIKKNSVTFNTVFFVFYRISSCRI